MSEPAAKIARVINEKTGYDIPHKLRQLADQIENGELGVINDTLAIFRTIAPNGARRTQLRHFGTGNFDTTLALLTIAEHRLLND